MKLCFSCRRITAGEAAYCQHCGKTFNVRLCSRGHANPRSANICSQCGSRELSTPQRKIPLLLKPMVFLLSHIVGVLLLSALVLFLGFFIRKIFINPNGLLPLMCIGLYLSLLFLIWMMLPNFIRKPIKWIFKRKGHKK